MWLTYQVVKSERKTLYLTVERDNSIVIKAPKKASDEQIRKFFEKKQLWIYTKLEEKKYLSNTLKNREFLNWEWFFYFWRMYKLKLVDNENFKLRFYKNTFELNNNFTENWKEIFIDWYKTKFKEKTYKRVEFLASKYWFSPNKISVKDLGNRWGSCTKNNNINFHWKVMLAPISVIDYIIIHELCHIKEKNHSPRFWDMLYKYMPDYEYHKEWLKRNWWELDL